MCSLLVHTESIMHAMHGVTFYGCSTAADASFLVCRLMRQKRTRWRLQLPSSRKLGRLQPMKKTKQSQKSHRLLDSSCSLLLCHLLHLQSTWVGSPERGQGVLLGVQQYPLASSDLTYAILTKLLLFLVCYVIAFWGLAGCQQTEYNAAKITKLSRRLTIEHQNNSH